MDVDLGESKKHENQKKSTLIECVIIQLASAWQNWTDLAVATLT